MLGFSGPYIFRSDGGQMFSPKRSFAALLILLVVFQCFSQIQRARTPLPVAIATGKARVSIKGTGGSSGDSIKVNIAKGPNAAPGPVEISVPPGTILSNGNSAGQNMVVGEVRGREVSENSFTPTSDIVLTGTAPVTYVLSAFCVNFEKDNPSESDSFSVGQPDSTIPT
jgi:hypothetical protein